MAKAEILIVEDNGIVARDLQNRLKNMDFDAPVMVPSGEEAIEKVKEHKPDLVLMDIMLKGEISGTEAAEQGPLSRTGDRTVRSSSSYQVSVQTGKGVYSPYGGSAASPGESLFLGTLG